MIEVEARNISVEYFMKQSKQSVMALADVNFTIQKGDIISIVGPSGCGKSTLLNVIAGLTSATSGQLLSSGQDDGSPRADRAMVFQSPALMPWRTVMGNIIYGLELSGIRPEKARIKAQKYVDMVGLNGFEKSYPHQISGGMQQRVNLARALTVEPSILLLDEPLSALDAQTRQYMQSELQRIFLEIKNTAIYVTHLISEAIYLADQVFVMSARPGRIKAVIPVELSRPRPLSVQQEPEFNQIERHVWQLIEEEADKMGMLIDEKR